MLISLLTGVAAGAVHVVGGADHLVAMAPFSLNKPWAAFRHALAWGAGHSTGVVVLALIAIATRWSAPLTTWTAPAATPVKRLISTKNRLNVAILHQQ